MTNRNTDTGTPNVDDDHRDRNSDDLQRGSRWLSRWRPLRGVQHALHIAGGIRLWVSALRLALAAGPGVAGRALRDRFLIVSSRTFDAAFYCKRYPDIASSRGDRAFHYVMHGATEGRQPNAVFDTFWYLRNYADVRASGMNPLAHYVRHGAVEGRDPSASFSTRGYLLANADVGAARLNPLAHYLRFGISERRPLGRSSGAFGIDPDGIDYEEWIALNDTIIDSDRELIQMRITAMAERPIFSIVMPVYETRIEHLREAIDSVTAQLYPNWELCIADDASPSPEVRTTLEAYAAADERIKVTYRASNGGIAACSNSALDLATGPWVVLMDHDDVLAIHALYMVAERLARHPDSAIVYSDEDHIDDDSLRSTPYFKPDWNPELLLGQNFINHLGAYRTDLVKQAGGFRIGLEGSQDWDLALRVLALAPAAAVQHIPFVLYHWRQTATAFSHKSLTRARESGARAVGEHVTATDTEAIVRPDTLSPYLLTTPVLRDDQSPLVSVVIPTRDQLSLLRTCLDGVLGRTDYPHIEVVVVDNGSTNAETLEFLDDLQRSPRIQVIRQPGAFNFSRLINAGVAAASGSICLLLNNDINVIEDQWLRAMVAYARRHDVGAVGAKLLYADGAIQHAGVIVGIGGVAGHGHVRYPRDSAGYFGHLRLTREVSAVTAACLAVRRDVFLSVRGFDETNLAIAFNDVDFCLRLRAHGYRNIWTPAAELFHLESASRGYEDNAQKRARFNREADYMRTAWRQSLEDPFYNPNLGLAHSYQIATHSRVEKPWSVSDPDASAGAEMVQAPPPSPPKRHYEIVQASTRSIERPAKTVLIGHSAAGKSRIARLLGLDRRLMDYDAFAAGKPKDVKHLFYQLLQSPSPIVVAPNVNDVLSLLTRRDDPRLKSLCVVYLKRPLDVLRRQFQLANEDNARHGAMSDAAFATYYRRQDAHFNAAADLVFEYDGADIDDVTWAFRALAGELHQPADRLPVPTKMNLFQEYLEGAYGRSRPDIPDLDQMKVLTAGGYQVFDTTAFPPRPVPDTMAALKLKDLGWSQLEFEGQRVVELGSQLGFFGFTAASLGATSVIGYDANPAFVDVANSIAAYYRDQGEWHGDRVMFRTQALNVGDDVPGFPDVIVANAILHWFMVQNPDIALEDVLMWLREAATTAVYFEGCVTAAEPIMREHGVSIERYNEDLFLRAGARVFRKQVVVSRSSYNPQRLVVRWFK